MRPSSNRREAFFLMLAILLTLGCSSESSRVSSPVEMDAGADEPDGTFMDALIDPDQSTDEDLGGLEPDLSVQVPDVGALDEGVAPDLGPLDGSPCDPRLRASACDPGFFCVHVPFQRSNVGRCQAGDGCRLGVAEDCPAERPYCHLRGGSTICTEVGDLRAGQDCVDEWGVPRPCAEGLACNNSVCQPFCDPADEESGCPDEGRCIDLEPAVGVSSGLCGPRNCNWFTGDGCDEGEKCRYAFRGDGTLVGSCTALSGRCGDSANARACVHDNECPDGVECTGQGGGNPEGSPCSVGNRDNCAQGLVCIAPPGREPSCKALCDTGGYEAPCSGMRACEERLATQVGQVRGYGLCVTNQ